MMDSLFNLLEPVGGFINSVISMFLPNNIGLVAALISLILGWWIVRSRISDLPLIIIISVGIFMLLRAIGVG